MAAAKGDGPCLRLNGLREGPARWRWEGGPFRKRGRPEEAVPDGTGAFPGRPQPRGMVGSFSGKRYLRPTHRFRRSRHLRHEWKREPMRVMKPPWTSDGSRPGNVFWRSFFEKSSSTRTSWDWSRSSACLHPLTFRSFRRTWRGRKKIADADYGRTPFSAHRSVPRAGTRMLRRQARRARRDCSGSAVWDARAPRYQSGSVDQADPFGVAPSELVSCRPRCRCCPRCPLRP